MTRHHQPAATTVGLELKGRRRLERRDARARPRALQRVPPRDTRLRRRRAAVAVVVEELKLKCVLQQRRGGERRVEATQRTEQLRVLRSTGDEHLVSLGAQLDALSVACERRLAGQQRVEAVEQLEQQPLLRLERLPRVAAGRRESPRAALSAAASPPVAGGGASPASARRRASP